MGAQALPWEVAWRRALFGPGGFYSRPEGPAGHFRTATTAAADVLAGALARLAAAAGCEAVVDVGAGRGELLAALARASPGLRLHGVDVVGRPAALPGAAGWTRGDGNGFDLAPGGPLAGALDGALVVCWELLDTVPCPVLVRGADGAARALLVEPATGVEHVGPVAAAQDQAWSDRWWPPTDGDGGGDGRVEVGRHRDDLWRGLVAAAARSRHGAVLLAADYAHTRATRPPAGTLAGYRAGRLVPPVPDGSCDVTAHVAVDAVAAAGASVAGSEPVLTDQRTALRALGVTGRPLRPAQAPVPAGDAPRAPDGRRLLAALVRAGAEAELLAPGGLGGFTWLLQAAGRDLPPALRSALREGVTGGGGP